MNDDILIPDIDKIEGKLLEHAEELDYLILDEVIHRQRRLPIARVQFAPIDLIDFLDLVDEGENDEDDDDEDEGDDDDDERDGDELEEEEREEDISDQPTVERTAARASEPTEATARSGLAEAAQANKGVDPHTRRLCGAVLLWIQHEVRRFVRNRPICTFRLRMYKPKGVHIASRNFKVENPSYCPPHADEPEGTAAQTAPTSTPAASAPATPAPSSQVAPPPLVAPNATPGPGPVAIPFAPAPAPAPVVPSSQLPVLAQPQQPLVVHAPPVQVIMPAPPPPAPPVPARNTPAVAIALGGDGHGQLIYLDPDTIPEARVWRALGHATEEFLGTVGRTYAGIIDLQARTVTHQAAQLDKSQALVENLAGQLLAARQVQRTDEAEQQVDERQLRVREELGKTFLSELGSLGRVLATSKLGVTPELVELGDIVSSSPELAEAVRDPNVRALLKDEKTTRELAQLLRLAAKKSNSDGGGTPPKAA